MALSPGSLSDFFSGALDLLFGSFCLFCAGPMLPGAGGLCSACIQELNPPGREICPVCGAAGDFPGRGPCLECQDSPPPFDLARSYAVYSGLARDLVLAYKYRNKPGLARPLGGLMGRWAGEALAHLGPVDVIAPVPLHPDRLRQRGYNQAALLAKRIGRSLGKPVDYTSLVRIKKTAPQSGLSGVERFLNVEGAFSPARGEHFKDRAICLVDDVFTSGATAWECARTVREAGAAKVAVLTFARAASGPETDWELQ